LAKHYQRIRITILDAGHPPQRWTMTPRPGGVLGEADVVRTLAALERSYPDAELSVVESDSAAAILVSRGVRADWARRPGWRWFARETSSLSWSLMLDRDLGHGLIVRLIRPQDAAELFALINRNRAHLRPWFEMVDQTRTPADTAAWIERMHERRKTEPLRGWSAIVENGSIVGAVGVTAAQPEKEQAEIGYYLAANACGRGLATRACAALLDHLFRELKLHRVGLRLAAGNERSMRLAGRLGFVCEGLLREGDLFDGQRRDVLVCGLLAREWIADAGA
jgi:ribosomal-protein-serine acetyltransferase